MKIRIGKDVGIILSGVSRRTMLSMKISSEVVPEAMQAPWNRINE